MTPAAGANRLKRQKLVRNGAALIAGLVLASPLLAQQRPLAPQPGARAPASDRCADKSRVLGVSRVVDIDATGGPRFGHQQYKEQELLAEGEVVLTFDDGPLRHHTQAVVDALEAQCTKATFFMVGSQALADPEMVRQIHRKGHTVGTHTFSHVDLRKQTPLKARDEIELGFSAVSQALGQPAAPFFRFPFLADTKSMKGYMETRGIATFSIDIDALDYRNKEFPDAVHQQVMNQLAYQKKGVLLFHDIQPSTARALPGLLAAIKAKGYRIVHLRPTAPVATLPEFDAKARRDLGNRRVASAANPLANRALTWPLPQGGALPQAGQSPQQGVGGPLPAQSALPPPLPVAQPPQAWSPPPAVAASPRPQRPVRPAADWRDSVFIGK